MDAVTKGEQPKVLVDVDQIVGVLGQLFDEGKKDVLLDAMRTVLTAANADMRAMSLQLAEALKRVYGRSSERIDPNQLRLLLDEMRHEAQPEPQYDPRVELPIEPPAPPPGSAKDRRRGRRPLPASLPREEVRLLPTPEQLEGKGTMAKLSEERSEVLEYEPARFKVIVYVRETWSNATGQIVTAPAPLKIIDKGMAGLGLLVHVVLSKYVDHCPLARLSRIFARDGVDLHRNRLVDWVAAVAFLLEPLARRILELAMRAHTLQVDDTRIDVLDQAKAKGIKRGHLWVLVGDLQWVAFFYTENWTAELAEQFLGGRIGWMQVDGYAGFGVVAQGRPILLVGCWMHARRYFVKALEANDVRAAEPLHLVGKIYEVERASKEAGDTHQQRFERRQRDVVPLLDELERWKDANAGVVPPNEPLGRAWTYLHNHWDMLRVVVQDGALELDNGEVERIIRGPAMGRRNWLFAGSDEGGERAATILTVLETAKRAGVDLREYLRDVLEKIAGGWKQSQLDELLPHVWAARRKPAQAMSEAQASTATA
jgi:transposase